MEGSPSVDKEGFNNAQHEKEQRVVVVEHQTGRNSSIGGHDGVGGHGGRGNADNAPANVPTGGTNDTITASHLSPRSKLPTKKRTLDESEKWHKENQAKIDRLTKEIKANETEQTKAVQAKDQFLKECNDEKTRRLNEYQQKRKAIEEQRNATLRERELISDDLHEIESMMGRYREAQAVLQRGSM